MKIGHAAAACGLTVKAIRHYETVGLVGDLERQGTYRDISDSDIETLKLIAHCRTLRFSLPEIRRVLSLIAEAKPRCPSPEEMLALVDAKLQSLRVELHELQRTEERLTQTRSYLETRRRESLP